MASKGRPRKSLDVKLFEGTYRPDRDGPATDGVCMTGTPERPAHLKGDGRGLWDQVVPRLVATGVAKAVDSATLTAMCEWWALYRRHMAALEKLPPRLRGDLHEQRLNGMASTSWKAFSQIAATFGLNPSDRAKLRIPAATETPMPVAPRRRDATPWTPESADVPPVPPVPPRKRS